MSKFLELLKGLIINDRAFERRAEEAYLAQAVDNNDLERRMRQIDRGYRPG